MNVTHFWQDKLYGRSKQFMMFPSNWSGKKKPKLMFKAASFIN